MTIYKATKHIYKYWLTQYNSGHETFTEYFMTEEKAIAWMNEDLDKYYNMKNEFVPVEKDCQMGRIGKIEKINVNE